MNSILRFPAFILIQLLFLLWSLSSVASVEHDLQESEKEVYPDLVLAFKDASYSDKADIIRSLSELKDERVLLFCCNRCY